MSKKILDYNFLEEGNSMFVELFSALNLFEMCQLSMMAQTFWQIYTHLNKIPDLVLYLLLVAQKLEQVSYEEFYQLIHFLLIMVRDNFLDQGPTLLLLMYLVFASEFQTRTLVGISKLRELPICTRMDLGQISRVFHYKSLVLHFGQIWYGQHTCLRSCKNFLARSSLGQAMLYSCWL